MTKQNCVEGGVDLGPEMRPALNRISRRLGGRLAIVATAMISLVSCSDGSEPVANSSATEASRQSAATQAETTTSQDTLPPEPPVATRPTPSPEWQLADGSTVGQLHISSQYILRKAGNNGPCLVYPGTILTELGTVHSTSQQLDYDILPDCPAGTKVDTGLIEPYEWNEAVLAEQQEINGILGAIAVLVDASEASQLTEVTATSTYVSRLSSQEDALTFSDLDIFAIPDAVGSNNLALASRCALPAGSEVAVLSGFDLQLDSNTRYGAAVVQGLPEGAAASSCEIGDVFALAIPSETGVVA